MSTETLVEVESADHVSLAGALVTAPDADICVVWIHGFGVSYDYRPCLELARRAAGAGMAFLSASVRGNHGAVVGWRRDSDRPRTVKIGSWYERLDDSVMDIRAWIHFARDAGFRRIVLAGHSFGALKVLRLLADPDAVPAIDGLVLASPAMTFVKLDPEDAATASEMVGAGDGEVLLPAGSWPTGFGTTTVSAQTYASWWDAAEFMFGGLVADTATATGARWASRIESPVLAWYGTVGEPGGAEELERLTAGMTGAESVEHRLLDGVTHHYRGSVEVVAAELTGWIGRAIR